MLKLDFDAKSSNAPGFSFGHFLEATLIVQPISIKIRFAFFKALKQVNLCDTYISLHLYQSVSTNLKNDAGVIFAVLKSAHTYPPGV